MIKQTGGQADEQQKQNFDALCSEIFHVMDKNDDFKVSVDEFIDCFFEQYKLMQEEIEELELRIKDQVQRSHQIEARLDEMRRLEKASEFSHPIFSDQAIMQGSILSVHVIDARDLRPIGNGAVNAARVRLNIEDNPQRTNEVPNSNNPVWNEVLAFDILTGQDMLGIEVQDVLPSRKNEIIGTTMIDLRILSEQQSQWAQHPDNQGKYH